MKTVNYVSLIMMAMLMAACGSKKVTTADMKEQETETKEAIKEARAESVELANMKEQYSVDQREADLKALKERKKEIPNASLK